MSAAKKVGNIGNGRKSLIVGTIFISTVLVILFIASTCFAQVQWAADGVPVCTDGNNQANAKVIPDGMGGAIITWQDQRSGSWDIYAQRMDSDGNTLWTADGVPVCTAGNQQLTPKLVTDSGGGAIITWEDGRSTTNWDIYAQRVDSSGNTLWANNGVAVCTAGDHQQIPQLVPDNSGAIITWRDNRSTTNQDIYAQKLDSGGNPLWTADGIAVCTAGDDQQFPQLVPDGAGGAIITWQDNRSTTNQDIYAQRVDSGGNPLWTADGVPVCTAGDDQQDPRLVTDGEGGVIIDWQDNRSTTNKDIYAQKLDSEGNLLWTADGVPICTAGSDQINPRPVTDSLGGSIITWFDFRSTTNWDVYAQRVDSGGNPSWTADGVAVCAAASDQRNPEITTDGACGAIITWWDFRSTVDWDVYAQRLDYAGAVQWTADGVAVCSAGDEQVLPQINSDGMGGAIIAWQDERAGNADVYAQKVSDRAETWYLAEGSTGHSTEGYFETWVLVQNPGATDATVNIDYMLPGGAVVPAAESPLTLSANSRQSISIANTPDVANEFSVSTTVTSDIPVIAERSMYWMPSDGTYRQSAHDSIGVTAPAGTWYLAEGSTGHSAEGFFETWVLVQNPGATDATVNIDYMLPGGAVVPAAESPLTLSANSRQSISIANTPDVANEFSVSTKITSNTPVIAERSMYWMPANGIFRQSAHDSIGVTTPADTWYLAEGSTGHSAEGYFETWVLMQNPGATDATVNIDYMLPGGAVIPASESPLTLPANSRQSISIAGTPLVADQFSVSTKITSNEPIIAERSMYWMAADGTYRQSAHDSIGVTAPADTWYLAEGSTGHSAEGYFETWVLVQNPGATDATVTIEYMLPGGAVIPASESPLTLPANSRQSIGVASTPEVADQFSVSTRVTSDIPVIAERSMYWMPATGIFRQAAHDSIGFWEY